MGRGWLVALMALALQWDLPIALGPLTVFHNELLLAGLALSLPWALGPSWRSRALPWAWAALPLGLWLLAHAPSVGPGEALKAALRAAQLLLALALPPLLLREAAERRLAWRAFFAALAFSSLWALAQSAAGQGSALNAGREVELIHGFQAAAAGMGHHNQLGAFLASAVAALAALILAGRERAWAWPALGLALAALLCSYSRGAWLGAALAAGLLLARAPRRWALAVLAAAALALLLAWSWPGGAFRERLSSLTADSERDLHRSAILSASEGHGLWGLGPQGLDAAVRASAVERGGGSPHPAFAAHAHNTWLEWGLAWGWPVLALWLLALAPLWRALTAGLRRSTPLAWGLLGALAAFGLQAYTDHLLLHARGAAVALVWGLLLAELQSETA
jgi:O-antigen ligase